MLGWSGGPCVVQCSIVEGGQRCGGVMCVEVVSWLSEVGGREVM
jgi:hypothetical protein